MHRLPRRDFLRRSASLVGAASAATVIPQSIRRALATPANVQSGTIRDVQHVVILMLENRSFDHYFGTMQGVRGFGDPFPITCRAANRSGINRTGPRSCRPII